MKTMSRTEFRGQSGRLEKAHGRIVGIGRIDEGAVRDAYRRWAPVYDHTFGRITRQGRRNAVEVINTALPGNTTANEAEFLDRIGWQFDPDLIVEPLPDARCRRKSMRQRRVSP